MTYPANYFEKCECGDTDAKHRHGLELGLAAQEGVEPDEAAAERWLAANDLYAVTHIHESKDCAECQAVVPVEEGAE